MVAGGFMAVEGLIVVEGFMAEAVAIKDVNPSARQSGTRNRPAFFAPSARARRKTPSVTAHAAASRLYQLPINAVTGEVDFEAVKKPREFQSCKIETLP